MVCINGESKTGYDGMPLPDVLEKEKYDIKRIAVEINGEIISMKKSNSETKRKMSMP